MPPNETFARLTVQPLCFPPIIGGGGGFTAFPPEMRNATPVWFSYPVRAEDAGPRYGGQSRVLMDRFD